MALLRRRSAETHSLAESDVVAHVYGERGGEVLAVTKFEPPPPPPRVNGEKLRRALEQRIDKRR